MIEKCPRAYTPEIPPACREFCPIARGQDVSERFFTSVSILKPGAPFYRSAINRQVKHPAMRAVMAARGDFRQGRNGKPSLVKISDGIPECAALAYVEFQAARKTRGAANRQEKKERAERRARGEKPIRKRSTKPYPERARDKAEDIVDVLRELSAQPIQSAVKDDEARAIIAQARGEKYKRATGAEIGRRYGRSREWVRQVKQKVGGG